MSISKDRVERHLQDLINERIAIMETHKSLLLAAAERQGVKVFKGMSDQEILAQYSQTTSTKDTYSRERNACMQMTLIQMKIKSLNTLIEDIQQNILEPVDECSKK